MDRCFQPASSWARRRASARRAWNAASRPSLRQLTSLRASRSPSSTAASTAQPGSVSCAQSRKRQYSARSSISGKALATAASSATSPTERRPGVSSTTPAPGSRTSSRWLVTWRPLPSTGRVVPVAMTASSARTFVRVDLPAPEGPSNTRVRPGARCARTASSPSPVVALAVITSTPGAAAATSSRIPSGSGTRSALVRMTSGCAPLPQASTSRRSMRPISGSGSRCSVTTTRSTFAARIWALDVVFALSRITRLRRGSSASTVVRSSGHRRTAAQSPTAGAAVRSVARAASTSRPRDARTSPSAPSRSAPPRSTRLTRAGRWSPASGANADANEASQPRSVRDAKSSGVTIEDLPVYPGPVVYGRASAVGEPGDGLAGAGVCQGHVAHLPRHSSDAVLDVRARLPAVEVPLRRLFHGAVGYGPLSGAYGVEVAATHTVTNQPPPLVDRDVFADDHALVEATRRHGARTALPRLHELGVLAGSGQVQRWAVEADTNSPQLRTHDRYGSRLDEVTFHPAWHLLMTTAVEFGLHAAPWSAPEPAPHATRGAGFLVWSQVESAHLCPISMTNAAVPALRTDAGLAATWEPRLTATTYDPGLRRPADKEGCLAGMAMTEKQGGSDVRANTTLAEHTGDDGWYALTGHKWFCSAPMNDVFLVLAQTRAGLTCFAVPRVLDDGVRNPFRLQRLKDKLGNRANASAEVEFDQTLGMRLGDEGRGVATISEMVAATRLDCVLGSAALMRRAVAEATWHAAHRSAFGGLLADAPLMQAVLADLAVESEAATVLAMRLAASVDGGHDPLEHALRRIGLH